MLGSNIDILCLAETKLDASFPNSQFHIEGYKSPYRLDVSSNSGLLIYIKETLPSIKLKDFTLPDDIQAIPIEINFRKSKWLILPLYRPERTPGSYATNNLCSLLDFYSNKYEHLLAVRLITARHHKTPTRHPQDTARHRKTPQDTARHRKTPTRHPPQDTRKTPQDTARHRKTPQDTARHCKTATRHCKGPQERRMQGYYRYSGVW